MGVDAARARSLEQALIASVTQWNVKTGAPAGADLLLAVLVGSAARLVAGCPIIADRVQLASDALEAFTLQCGVDPVAVMRYRLEHREGALHVNQPAGRA